MRSLIAFVVLCGLVAAYGPIGITNNAFILDSQMTASSFYSFGRENDYAHLARIGQYYYSPASFAYGWHPAIPDVTCEGEYLQIDLGNIYRIDMVETQGALPWGPGECPTVAKFNISTAPALEGPYTQPFEVSLDGPTSCDNIQNLFNGIVQAQFPHPIETRYIRFIIAQHECGYMRVEAYGDVVLPPPVSCPGAPNAAHVAFDTAPTCTVNSWTACQGHCTEGYLARYGFNPQAMCVNGDWMVIGNCDPIWPAFGLEACGPVLQVGDNVVAPTLVSQENAIVDAEAWTEGIVGHRDHLYMHYIINASYRVNHIRGHPSSEIAVPLQFNVPTIIPVPIYDDPNLWVKFEQPETGCFGHIYMRIGIGSLRNWGFYLEKDETGTYPIQYLVGQFHVNTSRRLVVPNDPDRVYWQEVEARFPFRIQLTKFLTTSLNPALTVYGSPNTSAMIILFKESDWPMQDVTIWYLLSVQYPFMVENVVVPPTFDTHTTQGAAISYTNVALTTDRGMTWCDAADTSNTPPKFCYQLLRVVYHHTGNCLAGAVTYTGQFWIKFGITCRPLDDPTWCHVPQLYVSAEATFTVYSNDICMNELVYDVKHHLTATMTSFGVDQAWPALGAPQTSFVVDNPVWFAITLSHPVAPPLEIDVLSLTLKEMSFGERLVYSDTDPGKWKLLVPYIHAIVNTANDVACNGKSKFIFPECKYNTFPMLHWMFMLDSAYLGLQGALTPIAVTCTATIILEYVQFGQVHTVELQATELQMNAGVAVDINKNFYTSGSATTALATGSSAGLAVGLTLAVLCIAGIGAFVVYKKRRNANMIRLKDTSSI